MEPAITITKLYKKYRKNSFNSPYIALRDLLTSTFKKKAPAPAFFWGLEDINLTIQPGERIGIMGHNGAGKSTLLKIISRITPPTSGRIVLNGRVASLLEVGTGFHPELTGRENIFLNGSILGLSKKEILAKLSDIISFSGIEEFIDMPLKNYSSGMQLRLAFSVAAFLEPEILLIDEVIAVGDYEFQKKCIGKMEDISKALGRTIVFVSHNMAAVKQLCTKGIVLNKGKVVFEGLIHEAIKTYTNHFLAEINRSPSGEYNFQNHPNKINADEGLMKASVFINGEPSNKFTPGSTIRIQLSYFLKRKLADPEIGVVIKDENYHSLIGLNNKHLGKKLQLALHETGYAEIIIPSFNLFSPGRYLVDLYFGDQGFYECLYDAFQLDVAPADVYKSGVELKPEWNSIYVPGIEINTL